MKLVCHPETPPALITAVDVEVEMSDPNQALLRYRVCGADLVLPELTSPGRADELWKTTCFELFLATGAGDAYFEFNFSPSAKWAAYRFEAYRGGRRDMQMTVEPLVDRHPELEPTDRVPHYVLDADVDFSDIPPGPLRAGLSAIIEEGSGRKSYWALAHPPGKPDFHHPDCFTLELPPPA